MASKLVVVFGATGNQGGSVIEAILRDPKASSKFKLRGVTRDTSKPASQSLAAKGVEMVAADLSDKSSLSEAIRGAYAVFAVTNYWDSMDADVETSQGKNLADVAKDADVQHFVWSTLPNVTKLTEGKLSKVYHFDSKAKVEDHIKSIGLPATFFLPGFYMSNIPGTLLHRDDYDGRWKFWLPTSRDALFPLIDVVADTGKFVKGILLHRDELLGQNVYGSVGYHTVQQIVEDFIQAFPKDGHHATYAHMPDDEYKRMLGKFGLPEHAQEEMLQNMQLLTKEHGGYYGGARLEPSHEILDEPLVTWSEYIKTAPAFKDLK